MTDEEKRQKIMQVVESEIEELRGSFSSFDCAKFREESFDKMYGVLEELRKKKEKIGAIKRILRAVKFK
jgi:GTP1/Obg family GTP-binding protein